MRRKQKLSREKLAFKIGVSPQQLFKYEIGESRIAIDRLVAIAEALDIKIINFFSISEIGEKSSLSTLSNDDSQILEYIAELKKLNGNELFRKILKLII